jgi:hypothetical protein
MTLVKERWFVYKDTCRVQFIPVALVPAETKLGVDLHNTQTVKRNISFIKGSVKL